MKRFILLAGLLLSFLLTGIFLTLPETGAQSSVPAGWTGISTRADLAKISANPGGQYILLNDIDLSGTAWTPLCSEDDPFTGTLDGDGHTVYGLAVSQTEKAGGLFSYLWGGTVCDLTVSGSSQGPMAGLLAGKISKGTIRDCSVSGTVSSSYYAGGIAGQISGTGVTLSGCVSSVTLSGTGAGNSEAFYGGLAGAVYGSGHLFHKCSFDGTLSSDGAFVFAGGITGGAEGGVTFSECSCEGTGVLTYTQSGAMGGIAGRAGRGETTFRQCSFKGDISSASCSGPSYLGGIVGQAGAYSSVSLSYCASYGTVTGKGHGNFLKVGEEYECITCSAELDSAGPVSHAGGIAGACVSFESWISVSHCTSYTDLSAKGGPVALGGIAGVNRAEGGSTVIHDCYSAGSIEYNTSVWGDLFSPIGGIAGSNGGSAVAQIRQCVSFCRMDVAYPLIDGAVVGYHGADAGTSGQVTLTQCYYRAGEREFFATPLSGSQLTQSSSYAGLDFISSWTMDPASGLPMLRSGAGVLQCPQGDVDGDGRISRYDAVLLTQYLTGATTLTSAQLARADYDGNGTVDALDGALILRAVQ